MDQVVLDSPNMRRPHGCGLLARVGVASGTFGALVAFLVATSGNFRSVNFALGYLGGDRLLISPTGASFGEGQVGEHRDVLFHVWNATGSRVRIVGVKTNCSCVAVYGLPVEIPSGHTAELNADVELTEKLSAKPQRIVFFSDYPNKLELCVSVSGRVMH